MRNRTSRVGQLNAGTWWAIGAAAIGAGALGYVIGRAVVRHRRRFDLKDKVVVLVGGSTGIGMALASELARHRARLAICARHEKELRATQQNVESRGVEVLAMTCDATDLKSVENFFARTRERYGHIEVLVNVAGTIVVGPAVHSHVEDFQSVMNTNFYGPLNTLLQVIPEMISRKEGRIVNIASFGGKVPTPHMASYAASKFALVGLSETLRTELLRDGVYVTTVCPGLVRSGSTRHALFKGQHEQEKALFETMANMPLLTIDPDKLARRIVRALIYGDAELTTPTLAYIQTKIHGLMPGLTTELITLVNQLLPHRASRESGDKTRVGSEIDVSKLTSPGTKSRQKHAGRLFQHEEDDPMA